MNGLASCIPSLAAIALTAAIMLPNGVMAQTQSDSVIFPPWSQGRNNPATARGLEFTIPQVDVMADFHGSLDDPRLVLFVGGNYFFAMAPLAEEFQKEHPVYAGKLFYVTIPPGLLVDAMRHGDTFTSGNMTFSIHPDVYAAGKKKVDGLVTDGTLDAPSVAYATNTLTIMVPAGNPGHVSSLRDFGKPAIKLVMPNPQFEGVARQIKSALGKTGGDMLVKVVYESKVADGTTVLTHIHHRQTPLFLMQHAAVAGVTWKSEAIFQEQIGNPITHVDIPAEVNSVAVYGAALVHGAPHAEAGKLWLEFLKTPQALAIFERYGFKAAPQ
ncbi:MAG: substrate-binding domain-containing protein [Candidatus Velthaea sp.]